MATSSMRRQMKNIVNKYSEAEVKVREATSNDAWGPSTSLMSEIADLSYNVIAFPEIMSMVWKRLNDHGKNWRHVYKALTLLDYLVKTGSERVAQQCRENIFAIQTLKDFQYVDRDGKDQGVNVRERAKHLVGLLKDDDRLRSERDQALKTKERLAQSVMGIGSGGERVTAHNGAHAHPHVPAQPHLAHGAPQPHLAHTTRSRPGSHNVGGTLMSPPPPDLDQVRPRNTGEEELQLQLALAMSKEEAEQVAAVGREEATQEERMRRGDDLRLQMALEESRKDSVSPTSQHNGQSQSQSHSSLLDLADVFAPAPTQPGWQGAPAPLAHHGGDAWGGPLPPSSAHPHGGDAWGEASAGGAWGAPHPAAGPPALGGGPWGVAGGGVPVPGTLAAQARWQQPPAAAASIASAPSQDAWGSSVTAGASARSWQPPGPLPLTSVATTSAWGPVSKSPSDPWSAFPESPASPPLPAYSTSPPPIPAASADPWAPLDGRAKSAATSASSAAFDPFGQTEAPYREEPEGFGRSGPTAPINTSAETAMPRGVKRPSRRGRGGLGLGRDGDDDEEEEGTQVVRKTGRSKQPRGGDDDEAKEVSKTRGFKESGGSGGDEVKEARGSKEPGGDEAKRTREPRRRPPMVPEPSQTPDEAGTRVPSARSSSRRRHAPVQNKPDKDKEVEGTSSEEMTEMRKSGGRKRRGTNKEDTVTPKRPRKRGAHDPVEALAKGLGRKTAKTETGSPSQPKADVSVVPMLRASGGNSAGRGSHKFVGGHMSISGGLWKAVEESAQLGARAFGLFLTSQRTWHTKPLDPCDAQRFRETCKQLGFTPDHIVPHGSYLLNCGSPSTETFEKSRAALVSELQRCEKLGLVLYNFHPGSSCGQGSTDACLERIASAINYAHERTCGVVTVIENMCGQGHTVGGQFEELRGIIDLVADQSRIGVCLDTCHAFAAGYDVSSQDGVQRTLDEFHRVVGLKFLKAVHLNDSKGKLGCHLDRHENVGRGHIGLEGFRAIMNAPQLDHLPMILETPGSPSFGYEEEIALLYSLCR